MQGKQIVDGPGGRRIITEAGKPERVALPMHCVDDACTPEEKAVLFRFTEASELAKGNLAVAIVNGTPRGRYSQHAAKVDVQTYAEFEIHAYRWILREAFGKMSGTLAEVVARLNGERFEGMTFEQWGGEVANTDDPLIALGAAIGSTRALAWALFDAYRDYAEFWRIRERAAQHGRALTEDDAARRVRRGNAVRNVVNAYRPQLSDNSGK